MPPRHGKSQLISEYFPAWYLGTFPDSRVILCSYGAEFARTWGRKSRDVLMEYGPHVFGVRVRDDSAAADQWNIYKHRGGMKTAGIGGDITGQGARLLIIDDPVKNWQEANSQLIRDRHFDWYTSTAYSRLTPDGRVIIVMTRWHHDDLAGRLLARAERGEGESWRVINLPAIAEDNDQLGRQPGQPLWPDGGFDNERLAAVKRESGSKVWVSLWQQKPSPEQGTTFKRSYFSKRYRALPRLRFKVMAIDSAFKEGVGSDYTAFALWGAADNGYYLIDTWRDKVEYPELKQSIRDRHAAWRPDLAIVEDKGSGTSAIQELSRDTRIPILAYTPDGSKISRAEAVTPLLEAGLCYFPEAADWLGDFIEEHIRFPKDSHDDYVDTTSMALNRLKTFSVSYTEGDPFDSETGPGYTVADVWEELNEVF